MGASEKREELVSFLFSFLKNEKGVVSFSFLKSEDVRRHPQRPEVLQYRGHVQSR